MDFITVNEAAQKWGISARRVQILCSQGDIKGVGRLGRMWLIPENADMPEDKRRCRKAGQSAETVKKQETFIPPYNDLYKSVQYESGDYALFFEIIRKLPLVLHIYRPDGTLFYGNETYLRMMGITSQTTYETLKQRSIIDDPLLEHWGLREPIIRALKGETVDVYDIKVPLLEIAKKYGDSKEPTTEILYQNFNSFPLSDAQGRFKYAATIFETARAYQGKEEIIKGKEYLENHWKEKFNIEAAASASSLSRSHFSRQFKLHTGQTPHEYHQNLKISRLQKLLSNPNFSVAHAFSECGMEYNSHYLDIFREITGMSPNEYRKESLPRHSKTEK